VNSPNVEQLAGSQMFDSLVGTRPQAAVDVCVVLMKIFPFMGLTFAAFGRFGAEKVALRLPLPRRTAMLIAGFPMALVSYFFWGNPSATQSAAAFAMTVACCWTWTLLASRWQEWLGGAVGIGVWLAVPAAAGIGRIAILLVFLTSFAYLFLSHHFASRHAGDQALQSGGET
jgi:hypothetical protein